MSGLFAIKHVCEDGMEVTVCVDEVQPLDFGAMLACVRSGRRLHRSRITGRLYEQNGELGRRCTASFDIEFRDEVPFYGLVPGGALPPQYLMGSSFVLDRNVISRLRRVDASERSAQGIRPAWTEWLNTSENVFNPLSGVFEGGHRRLPTPEEFAGGVSEVRELIQRSLPLARILPISDDILARMYAWRLGLNARTEREMEFLVAVNAVLCNRVSGQGLSSAEAEVIALAQRHRVTSGLVLGVVAAVLFEPADGGDEVPARRVLKFKHSYSSGDAYNAVSDLRSLEFMALSAAIAGRHALLTADHPLALLWCGLNLRPHSVEDGVPRVAISCDRRLLPRIREARHPGAFNLHLEN